MSEHPKVSVVLSVYNKAEFLEETLEQILEQSFSDWELIAVDDGSSDGSGEILTRFAMKEYRMQVIHQKNAGVSAARNKGLALAAGDWIWFVDGDDLPAKDFLTKVFSGKEQKGIDLIAANFRRRYPDGKIQTVETDRYDIFTRQTFPEVFMREQYENGFWGYLWNKLFRRETLLHTGILFQEDLTLAEDLQFLTELYQQDISICTVPLVSMTYRMLVSGSLSRREIDYRQQLNLQLATRKWILEVRPCRTYEQKFRWLIRTCVVCIVLSERDVQEKIRRDAEKEERKENINKDTGKNGTKKNICRNGEYALGKDWKITARKLAADPVTGASLTLFPWKRLISPAAWCIRRGDFRLLEYFLCKRRIFALWWHRRRQWLKPMYRSVL